MDFRVLTIRLVRVITGALAIGLTRLIEAQIGWLPVTPVAATIAATGGASFAEQRSIAG